jgi:hypothetical protein
MGSFMLKLIGVLIVVGAIFFTGVAVGSSSETELSTEQLGLIERCVPIATVADLYNCAQNRSTP